MEKVFVPSSVKKQLGLRGIVNLGNTCYMNAVLQCLLCVPSFVKLLQETYVGVPVHPVILETKRLAAEILKGGSDASDSRSLFDVLAAEWTKSNSNFNKKEQQDAQEFLSFFVGLLHSQTLYEAATNSNIISVAELSVSQKLYNMWHALESSKFSDLFYHQLVRFSKCDGCSMKNLTAECSFPVTLTLCGSSCTVEDCLKYFCENVRGIVCDVCKETTKQTKLLNGRLPPVLIIHLSRFSYNAFGGKLDTTVQFSPTLNMEPYCVKDLQSNMKYDLVAVTNHKGHLISSGHYTAYCQKDTRWFLMDDSTVSSTTVRRVVSEFSYLLWYKLKAKESGGLPFDSAPEIFSTSHCPTPPPPLHPSQPMTPSHSHPLSPQSSSPVPALQPVPHIRPPLLPLFKPLSPLKPLFKAPPPPTSLQSSPVLPLQFSPPLPGPSITPVSPSLSPPTVPLFLKEKQFRGILSDAEKSEVIKTSTYQ